MTTALAYSSRFRDHRTPTEHPERPQRLDAIVRKLKSDGLWPMLMHLPNQTADPVQIQQVHQQAYLDRLEKACRRGAPFIDTPDSAICPDSFAVALAAAGSVLGAVDAVIDGTATNAFCLVRPPGHHAEADRSMGFCLLNNAAIAANHLLTHHRLERVAMVDFDVHHGNGTQHLFEDRADVLYISVHEHPSSLYPGTGYEQETGTGAGAGLTVNLPLAAGSGDEAVRAVFLNRVLPAVNRYRPDALVVSAGFDAAAEDPLGHLTVTGGGFSWISQQLVQTAQRLCDGRLISVLEGGYDLDSLARDACGHVRALLESV